MMYRTAAAQSEHDRIVRVVVDHLVQQRYQTIRADLDGYDKPELIRGTKQDHIPDVTADGVVVEVETADSLDTDHTKSQLQLFDSHAGQVDTEFWVVVPSAAEIVAAQRLRALGLTRAQLHTVGR